MNRLISASAGSGKTFALTTQYLSLLRARQAALASGKASSLGVESLLAATFTRKAAGEIFDRILSRLAAGALDESGLTELRVALSDKNLTREDCQELLLHLCRSLHRVQVGTLDSFFQRLCQVYRQEAGLSGGVRMTDPKSPRCLAMQKAAVRAMLEEIGSPEGTSVLLGEVGSPEGASILFQRLMKQKASAAVVPKIVTLLQGISEMADGAALDCWDKLQVPVRPPQEKIDRALDNLDAYLLALMALPDDRWPKAVRRDLKTFRAGQWEEVIKMGLAKRCWAGTFTYYNVPIPPERITDYEILLAVVRHELLKELRDRTLAMRDAYTVFTEKFAQQRRAEGFVLFSETPALLTGIIGGVAETARRLDAPLEHMLLDEFQDTSDPQWNLLRGFALKAAEKLGSVFVVGDAKQAIYGWRGGRAEIFERLGTEIKDIHQETLEKSYRSSEVVLTVVNKVFADVADNEVFQPVAGNNAEARADSEKNARNKKTVERWAAYFKQHEAAKNLPGLVELSVSPVPPSPQVQADDGDEYRDQEDDGEDWNAAGASYHLNQCAARIAGEARKLVIEGRSVGVLVRTNKTLAQMTDLLRRQNISVSSEGVGKVVDDPAVELLLSGLLLADHPGHSAAAYHVAASPLGSELGIGIDDFSDVTRTAGVSAAIRANILSEGYAGVLARWASLLAPHGTERTARRLEQTLETAADFDALPPMRPSEFVRAIRESSVENPGAAAVRVMTINRAKGLEFDAVFLPDLEWKTRVSDKSCLVKRASTEDISHGNPPIEAVYARPNETLQSCDPELLAVAQNAEDEEVTGMLCLLYVAMTRSRYALHMYVEPHRMTNQGVPHKPGLKPAAILRAALCGSAIHAVQGENWETTYTEESLRLDGSPPWYETAPRTEASVGAGPADRPAVRFAASVGRRSRPTGTSERAFTPRMATDLLKPFLT